MSITLRVQELREVRTWSQAELARQSGVDQSVISRLERGETKAISFKNLERLADALGCDPGYLIFRR
jgi:transcriptional regulator with XRE-family HTH domain